MLINEVLVIMKRSLADVSVGNVEKKKLKSSTTVLDKVVNAIRGLKSPSGSSTKAIISYILKEEGQTNENAIKKACKNGVIKGHLEQLKASYLVKGENYESTEEKVEILERYDDEDDAPITSSSTQRVVEERDQVTISYTGCLESTRKQFDAGKSFTFQVKAGDVIKGMDQGVLGMKVGSRRKLLIPSSLGYGKRGSKPDIPPDAALIFDIKLLKIHS